MTIQPRKPRVGGTALDPRGMTQRPELGAGARPHPGAPVIHWRVRTCESKPSSRAPTPVRFSHPRPVEAQPLGPLPPSPGAPGPWAVPPPPRGSGCPPHQPPANPGLAHHSEALPGTAHLRALATGPQGCLGRRGTTRDLSPAVQGSAGHQLGAPGSVWVEETVEGAKPGGVLLGGEGAL